MMSYMRLGRVIQVAMSWLSLCCTEYGFAGYAVYRKVGGMQVNRIIKKSAKLSS